MDDKDLISTARILTDFIQAHGKQPSEEASIVLLNQAKSQLADLSGGNPAVLDSFYGVMTEVRMLQRGHTAKMLEKDDMTFGELERYKAGVEARGQRAIAVAINAASGVFSRNVEEARKIIGGVEALSGGEVKPAVENLLHTIETIQAGQAAVLDRVAKVDAFIAAHKALVASS
jgi:hypothetical protein